LKGYVTILSWTVERFRTAPRTTLNRKAAN
jgi:hypothetical protein